MIPKSAVAKPKGDLPTVPRHEEVDLLIRQASKRLHLGAFDLMELLREAIDGKFYERFNFADAAPYIESRTGLAYRSVMRQLQILDGLRALPPGDLEEAKGVLAELGTHRAAIVAPALEKEPADWREWAALARQGTEEALQDAVSSALGLRARGKAGEPGEAFLRAILARTPPERHAQIEWVFQKMATLGDPSNKWSSVAVFLQLVVFGEQELAAHGILREGKA